MIIAYYPGAGGNRFLQRMLGNQWSQPDQSYDLTNLGQIPEHRYLTETSQPKSITHTLTHCMNSAKIQQVFPGQPMVFLKSDLARSLQREWVLHGHERFCRKTTVVVPNRLEHYRAIRDPSWPDITTIEQLKDLPELIHQEVDHDYATVAGGVKNLVPGVLAGLTQGIVDRVNSAYEIIRWHKSYYQQYPQDFVGAQQVLDIDNDQDEFCALMRTELGRYHSDIFDQVWKALNE